VLNPSLSSQAATSTDVNTGVSTVVSVGEVFTLSETLGVANANVYTPGAWGCVNGSVTGNQVTVRPVDAGKAVVCTLTNTGASADMAASTVTSSVTAAAGVPLSVQTACTNNGPDAAANPSCLVTGAPVGAVTTCGPNLASLAVGSAISCTTTWTPAQAGSVTLTTTAKSVTFDPDTNNNVVTTDVLITTAVSGRVYMEASSPANTTFDGLATDPAVSAIIQLSCSAPDYNPPQVTTAADGTYTFSGVPGGATCTITQTQPDGYTNAYSKLGTGATGAGGGAVGSGGDSTIALVVPVTGSVNNDFAEQAADTTSTLVCTPALALAGEVTSCTATCLNTGPGSASNASCQFTGALPADVISNTCEAPSTQAILNAASSLSCTVTFPMPVGANIVIAAGSGATNDPKGGTVPTATNNASSTLINGVAAVTVSGRVYREATGDATDNGNAADPGMVTQVAIACTAPVWSAGPVATDGTGNYAFSGIPSGATCTITETQPAGFTNAYATMGPGGNSISGSVAGSSTDSTIRLLVPTTGSSGNNFAEQTQDITTQLTCTPNPVTAGQTVTCTAICRNSGPGVALNATCQFTGALPAGVLSNTCAAAVPANLASASSRTCILTFTAAALPVTVTAGGGATNDVSGGADPSAGNNPASTAVTALPVSSEFERVPLLQHKLLALLTLMLLAVGGMALRRQR
jgi:hypothetical protein